MRLDSKGRPMKFDKLLVLAKQKQKDLEAVETSVFSRPTTVVTLGMKRILVNLKDLTVQFFSNLVYLAAVVCVVVPYAAMHFYEPAQPWIYWANAWIQDGIFWLVLGILSSVGFGTGMHSGLLFLFPHVFRICLAADECAGMDFHTNAFYKGGPAGAFAVLPIGDTPDYCNCPAVLPTPGMPVPGLIARVLRVMWPCFLWGAGTAIGEIPPYLMALKARASGDAERMLQDEVVSGKFEEVQQWMIEKVREWGFWGVFFFAAYPNVFFDLCGLCCGMIGMNFWTFFGAVLLGKGIVKAQGQAVFFCLVFSKSTVVIVEDLTRNTLIFLGLPDRAEQFASTLQSQLKQFHPGAKQETKEQTNVQIVIQLLVASFMIYFLAKAIENFAKDQYSEQVEKHFEEIAQRWETEKQAEKTKKGTKAEEEKDIEGDQEAEIALESQNKLAEWVRPWQSHNGAELGVLIQVIAFLSLYFAADREKMLQTFMPFSALVALSVAWVPLGHQVENFVVVILIAALVVYQYY